MRNLIGLEMVCFCKSRHFEMTYEGGGYVDDKQEPVDDLLDMICYMCSASYYTREGEPIPYCPNCGHFDRKRFDQKEQLMDALRGYDMSWLKKNGMKALAVHTWDGDWQLKFAKSVEELERTAAYRTVRSL